MAKAAKTIKIEQMFASGENRGVSGLPLHTDFRLDGSGEYRVTLPPDIPAARFWSLTAYDNQTRSMLQTPQRYPRAGSQSYPTPAATAAGDGSTTIVLAAERPADVPEGNWVQTDPGKGWFVILRLYSPLPSFFDMSWRIGELQRTSGSFRR